MENRDGFDFRPHDEVDALISDVKDLLNDVPDEEPEVSTEEDVPQPLEETESDASVETPVPQNDPMTDATILYKKPLTFYEQSKPAYQTARRAQYEREREKARQAREQQRLAREAAEERKMQELEQLQRKPRRRAQSTVPTDEEAYSRWLYAQGTGEETVMQREQIAQREHAASPRTQKKQRHPLRAMLLGLLLVLIVGTAVLFLLAKQPSAEGTLGTRRENCATILLAGTDQDGYRTDTMMLLTIDRARGSMSLVSIPRDTLVFCEYSVPKINSAYGWGGGGEDGMQELLLRVTEIIGFEPDGYVLIDLEGFEKLVDRMGGVDFNVPMDMQYSDPSQNLTIHLRAGEQRLNGSAAMQLVRFRSGYAMADLDRVTVQRSFVKSAMHQWISPEKLYKLPGAISLFSQYAQSNLSTQNYLWLAESVLFCDLESIRMETLPGAATYISGGSYYVLDPVGVAETVNTCCAPYEQGVAVSDLSIRVG